MACNRPIVCTDVGDVRWLFGNEKGFFITSYSKTELASKIIEAISFSETKGRERLTKLNLDSRAIAKRIIKLYQSI